MSRQFEAFREGFEEVFPLSTLQSFYPEEVKYRCCPLFFCEFKPLEKTFLKETVQIVHMVHKRIYIGCKWQDTSIHV